MGTASPLRIALLALGFGLAAPAWADDDDFDFGDLDAEDEDSDADQPKPVQDDGDLDDSDPDDDEFILQPSDDADGGEEFEFEDDLLDEDPGEKVGTRGAGEDTAKIYREALDEYARMGPDEEALAWERYLKKWPNSIFKDRIEQRLDELNQELYEGRLDASYQRTGDAGKAELNFSVPLHLESIDPRTKLRMGFEWGIPNWVNLFADYERQIFRELSAHAGVRQRFTGWTFETGARYAMIKSARTQFLLTAIGDVRFNLGPTFPAFRPQLGMGKRFEFGSTKMDVNLQGGSELALIRNEAGDSVFSPASGGANIMVMPSDTVRVYVETSTYMKGRATKRRFDPSPSTSCPSA